MSEWALREASLGEGCRKDPVPKEGEGAPGWRNGVRDGTCGVTYLEPEHRDCTLMVLGPDHRTYCVLPPESAFFIQMRNPRLWKVRELTQGHSGR